MIELTERIGADPVFRVTPAEKPLPIRKDGKREAEDAEDRPQKKIVLGDEDDKGENFDETV